LGSRGRRAAAISEGAGLKSQKTIEGCLRRSDDEVGFKPSYLPVQRLASCGYYARNPQLGMLIMTRFMFLVLERHRVVAPISPGPLAALVPAL
jgi:hypothetical protein